MEDATLQDLHIMELIASAPWRDAVTYRESSPHEYVVVRPDGKHELLAEFGERTGRGERVECQLFHEKCKCPLPGHRQVLDYDGVHRP